MPQSISISITLTDSRGHPDAPSYGLYGLGNRLYEVRVDVAIEAYIRLWWPGSLLCAQDTVRKEAPRQAKANPLLQATLGQGKVKVLWLLKILPCSVI